MLKLLKWAYRLGVKQENLRIRYLVNSMEKGSWSYFEDEKKRTEELDMYYRAKQDILSQLTIQREIKGKSYLDGFESE